MKTAFSDRLKALLEQKNLTLAEVAKAIEISTTSVHRWTRGGEIDYENLRALADFLDVNWIWLRYGDEAIEGLRDSISSNDVVAEDRRKYLSAIVENEARLNLAQDMARIVTWEWSVLTDELTASSNAIQIFGRPLEDVRLNLLPFASMAIDDLIDKFSKSEFVHEWDFNLSSSENLDECWFESRARLILDGLGRPLKMIGVSIDITQRKSMQQALVRNEYLLRKVIETIPVGLWIADQSGKITTANPEAERIWGGAKFVELDQYGEYKGWWESSGEQIGSAGWTLARAVKNGEMSRGEIVNIEAFDGEIRTIIMSAIPLLNLQNNIIGAIEVNQDITEIKHTEQALRAKEMQWNSIFEQPSVGIAYQQNDSDVLYVNSKLAALLGTTIDVISNEKIEVLFAEDTKQEFLNHISKSKNLETANFAILGKLSGDIETQDEVLFSVVTNSKPDGIFKVLIFVVEIPKN